MSRPRFTFPRVAPRTRKRPPRGPSLPPLACGIYDPDGTLRKVTTIEDPRVSDPRGDGLEIVAPEVRCGAKERVAAMSLKAYMDGSTSRRIAKRESPQEPRLTAWPQPLSDDDRDNEQESRTDLPDVTGDDSDDARIDRKTGPHWGNFWPPEHVPEYDAVFFEPQVPKHATEAFAVYSNRGLMLGRFDDRWRAIGALNRWPHADFVLCDGEVIARKRDAAIKVGDKVGPDDGDTCDATDAGGQYEVKARTGYVLGRFADLTRALECLDRWPAARQLVCGSEILASKLGDKITVAGRKVAA